MNSQGGNILQTGRLADEGKSNEGGGKNSGLQGRLIDKVSEAWQCGQRKWGLAKEKFPALENGASSTAQEQ